MKLGGLLLFFVFVVAMVGCADKEPPQKTSVIAERFQKEDISFEKEPQFIALLELKKNPALLVTATRVDGKTRLNPSDIKSILKEQEEMRVQIRSISPEIKIVYTYKMVLNAMAIIAPQKYAKDISELDVFIEPDERFGKPETLTEKATEPLSLTSKNSMIFIGVDRAHQMEVTDERGGIHPLTGHGIKIGIIDSGIDYTHSMLGGSGSVLEFEAIHSNEPSNLFPNKKVVGGTDFVGDNFDTSSESFEDNLPRPDDNPIDMSGHGSHVAGTAAGVGDSVNTYSGVAPEAQLFALKVFGDKEGGSTSDTVVIAALEYAADPNGDLDPVDQLDVVNISLGSGYGKPHDLYEQAIGNLVRGGTLVVAAAGNSGIEDNVVGAPSTASYALSVAGSIDDMEHNWRFEASEFSSPSVPSFLVEAISGTVSQPISESDGIAGSLVFVGEAKEEDLTDELKTRLVGRVALIDRGTITFQEKLERVKGAGAIGVVIVNNVLGPAVSMGGELVFIPAIMITKEVGDHVKELMETEDVTITFKQPQRVERPELIDTLIDFSSKGPRSLDALLKPEITAPGLRIISAAVGTGNKAMVSSGTSMAAPHVTGVIALLKQLHPQMEPQALKALVMNTSKSISDETGEGYPVSRQGAGRIQAMDAAISSIVVREMITPERYEGRADLSLGELGVESIQTVSKTLEIKNFSHSDQTYSITYVGSDALTMELPSHVTVSANGGTQVPVTVIIDGMKDNKEELDAFILFKQGTSIKAQVPVLAVINRVSHIVSDSLKIFSSSLQDSVGVNVEMQLANRGVHEGHAYLFNILGLDDQKPKGHDPFKSRACDLKSVGHRIVEKEVEGNKTRFFQMSVKLFESTTSWGDCYIFVEVDADGDGISEQEIIGTRGDYIPGIAETFGGLTGVYASFHIDSKKAEQQRKINEENPDDPLDYVPALIANEDGIQGINEFINYEHSTLAIIEVKVDELPEPPGGQLSLRVTVVDINGYNVEEQDSLNKGNRSWVTVSPDRGAYLFMPPVIELSAGTSTTVKMKKGLDQVGELLLLTPQNAFALGNRGDRQSAIVNPIFEGVKGLNPHFFSQGFVARSLNLPSL